MSHKAFSLIELLLVLVMLAMVLAMSAPYYSGAYKTVALRKTAEDLTFVMRYAQAKAVTHRRAYHLNFSDTNTAYWLTYQPQGAEEDPTADEPVIARIGRQGKVPSGVTLSTEQNPMVFSPDGVISKNRVTVSTGKKSLIVSSYEQRGYVFIFDG